MLTFAIEPLSVVWNEAMVLATQHWYETEGYRHGQNFCPDAERYFNYNASGYFLMYTARDEGKLVGYAGMYYGKNMHTQLPIVTEDTWFLLPEYRKGWNAIRFHRYVQKESERICRVLWPTAPLFEILMTAKNINGAGPLLEHLDYEPIGVAYSKQIVLSPPADSGASETSEVPADVRAESSLSS